jgi:hypothetical protein
MIEAFSALKTELLFQLPQPLRVAPFQPTELALPPVKTRTRDPVPPAQFPSSTTASGSFSTAMICSSLNRLFRTTPAQTLGGSS